MTEVGGIFKNSTIHLDRYTCIGIAIEVIRVTEFDSEGSFDLTGHFKAILVS